MLMQNFKSAADLGITDPQLGALVKVLGMLERNELVHARGFSHPNGFNMANGFAEGECGTIGCIAGWADSITRDGRHSFLSGEEENRALWVLFAGGHYPHLVTTEQAATALRSYLTTGDARWDLAIA